jgi:hypothetical protein
MNAASMSYEGAAGSVSTVTAATGVIPQITGQQAGSARLEPVQVIHSPYATHIRYQPGRPAYYRP